MKTHEIVVQWVRAMTLRGNSATSEHTGLWLSTPWVIDWNIETNNQIKVQVPFLQLRLVMVTGIKSES